MVRDIEEAIVTVEFYFPYLRESGQYKVTSNKNGNSIFLPAAGDYDGSSYEDVGVYGGYWANNRPSSEKEAYYIFFGARSHSKSTDYRYAGWSIRPVHP